MVLMCVGIPGKEAVRPGLGTERRKGCLGGPGSRKDSNHPMMKGGQHTSSLSLPLKRNNFSNNFFTLASLTQDSQFQETELGWLRLSYVRTLGLPEKRPGSLSLQRQTIALLAWMRYFPKRKSGVENQAGSVGEHLTLDLRAVSLNSVIDVQFT